MLTIDESATTAIHELTNAAGVALDGGLRIALATDTRERDFDLSIASGPADGDRVVVCEAGARVFLEPGAADLLSDKVLDVRRRRAGRVHFGVYPQN
ncbi:MULTISPECIES: hypothetical protein [Saccharothrix]|uniref:hypothetical protein n=1 Tax=Saccharothrix TaxID=2071 RepID=UPI00093AA7BD|nr:hypothetical protein [Saccharothrix sp. CB00851]OKI28662.1 hypothetical protein A6A25_31125 [Saccharothrix sp. CB00851]